MDQSWRLARAEALQARSRSVAELVCVCVRARTRARVCVRACVRACWCACVRVSARVRVLCVLSEKVVGNVAVVGNSLFLSLSLFAVIFSLALFSSRSGRVSPAEQVPTKT